MRWILTCSLLLYLVVDLAGQNTGVTLTLSDCVYNKGKGELGFRLTMQNHSSDTVHVLSAFPAGLFSRSPMPHDLFGLANRPFKMFAENLAYQGSSSIQQETKNYRYVLEASQFVDIPPGEEKHLGYVTMSKREIAVTSIPGRQFPLRISYELSGVRAGYISDSETAELRAIHRDLEDIRNEMKPLSPRVIMNYAGSDSLLKHYAYYQARLNKLNVMSIMSNEAMVQVE